MVMITATTVIMTRTMDMIATETTTVIMAAMSRMVILEITKPLRLRRSPPQLQIPLRHLRLRRTKLLPPHRLLKGKNRNDAKAKLRCPASCTQR